LSLLRQELRRTGSIACVAVEVTGTPKWERVEASDANAGLKGGSATRQE